MTLLAVIVAIVLAFIVFKFVKGLIKLAVLAAIVLFCIFVAREAGAF